MSVARRRVVGSTPNGREHPEDVRHYQRSGGVAKLGLRDPVGMDLEGAPTGRQTRANRDGRASNGQAGAAGKGWSRDVRTFGCRRWARSLGAPLPLSWLALGRCVGVVAQRNLVGAKESMCLPPPKSITQSWPPTPSR